MGKTTLARLLFAKRKYSYLNWDVAKDRESILRQLFPKEKYLIFDEIHKFRQWRGFIKGLYDTQHKDKQILVTGSARLDYYRHSGDSLQGRYFYYRLHPLSVSELAITSQKDLADLLRLGGFPEPFFSDSLKDSKRWSRDYRQRFIQEDVTSLELSQNLGEMELLLMRLPELVGSPLSLNALREDIQVSFATVKKWLEIFERMYSIFRLAPFASPLIRAVKKEQKHYHFDWSLVTDDAARFENLVACHFLKLVHYEQDTGGRNLELKYFRDTDGREVDFIITEDNKMIMAAEVKLKARDISKNLLYLKRKFPQVKAYQIHSELKKEYHAKEGIRLLPITSEELQQLR